jgi:hypothetical protein
MNSIFHKNMELQNYSKVTREESRGIFPLYRTIVRQRAFNHKIAASQHDLRPDYGELPAVAAKRPEIRAAERHSRRRCRRRCAPCQWYDL